MARSVGTHNEAVVTVFTVYDGQDWYEFEEFLDGLRDVISHRYPSFYVKDDWADREGRIILRNNYADVVVYEYCGLVSINLVPRNSPHHYKSNLALGRWWCNQVAANFEKLLHKSYECYGLVGRFSNGEAIYERVER